MASEQPSTLASVRGQARDRVLKNLDTLLVVVAILAGWEYYSRFVNTRGELYFPSIDGVIYQVVANQSSLLEATRVTYMEATLGWALGVTLGVIIGILYGESLIIRQASLPVLVFMYSLPFAIVAPLFVIWFGTDVKAIALFVALSCFYYVFINVMTGFTHIDREYNQLSDVIGATKWQRVTKLKIWLALPHMSAGIKVAVLQAYVGAIVAEFIASGNGLGYIILFTADTGQLGVMFGAIFLIMIGSIGLFKLVDLSLNYLLPPGIKA